MSNDKKQNPTIELFNLKVSRSSGISKKIGNALFKTNSNNKKQNPTVETFTLKVSKSSGVSNKVGNALFKTNSNNKNGGSK